MTIGPNITVKTPNIMIKASSIMTRAPNIKINVLHIITRAPNIIKKYRM